MQGTVKLPELAERLSGPTQRGRHRNANVINVQRSSVVCSCHKCSMSVGSVKLVSESSVVIEGLLLCGVDCRLICLTGCSRGC